MQASDLYNGRVDTVKFRYARCHRERERGGVAASLGGVQPPRGIGKHCTSAYIWAYVFGFWRRCLDQ